MKLNKDHIFYEIKLQTLEADRKSLLESAEIFEKNLKKKKKKNITWLWYEKIRSI